MTDPVQRPEGALLARLRHPPGAPRVSMRAAAKRAAIISEGRWRQIENGYLSTGGQRVPVVAPADTLASMVGCLGGTPEQLREVGRDDAADVLEGRIADGSVTEQRILDISGLDPDDQQLLIDTYRRLSGRGGGGPGAGRSRDVG